MEAPSKGKAELEMPKIYSLSDSPRKEAIVETCGEVEEDFASPTPVKTKEPSRIQSEEELAELPEKLGILLEFFNSMTSSLRLLGLRKQTPSFKNISSQVEVLTGRKFLSMHLAQIKYIFPEALQIDKILIHDEQTKCMMPDIKIVLLFDVVEGHHEESAFVALSSLFSSKLKDFFVTHPKDSDVPEAVLPEPFNQRKITTKADPIAEDSTAPIETEMLNSSHFSSSFRKSFCQKSISAEIENTDLPSHAKSACETNEDIERTTLPDLSSQAGKLEATPVKLASGSDSIVVERTTLPDLSSEAGNLEATPLKLASGSDCIVVETPVQCTPMRSISPKTSVLTCEDENKATASQTRKQSTLNAKKSLDFYRFDGEDSTISHKQSSVCLSDLVLLIHQIFRSANFCPITKEELVQKITMYNCEIDDQSEVETQMEHLEKLVPDWFFKKLAPSGDLLYNVKNVSDLNSVCERINVV